MWIVYKVKIEDKCYIGITSKGLDWRKRRHQVEARRGLTKTVFHNKLAKNIDSAEWVELESVTSMEEAVKLEKKYIIEYNTKYPSGLNLTDGGEGILGHIHTEEAKQKIAKANIGRKHSKETKELMSKNRKGISTGVPSAETKVKRAISMGSKEFDVFTKDGKLIGTWISKSQCARDLGISRNTIIRQLKEQSSYYNVKYIFRKKDGKV